MELLALERGLTWCAGHLGRGGQVLVGLWVAAPVVAIYRVAGFLLAWKRAVFFELIIYRIWMGNLQVTNFAEVGVWPCVS